MKNKNYNQLQSAQNQLQSTQNRLQSTKNQLNDELENNCRVLSELKAEGEKYDKLATEYKRRISRRETERDRASKTQAVRQRLKAADDEHQSESRSRNRLAKWIQDTRVSLAKWIQQEVRQGGSRKNDDLVERDRR